MYQFQKGFKNHHLFCKLEIQSIKIMVKIGKYHANALKISMYFFVSISVIILLVNIVFYYGFKDHARSFPSHYIEHLIFTLSVSIAIYYLLSKDQFVKIQFREVIKEEEKKFQLLFENSNDAILLIKEHYIIDCNLKSCEIFNCEKRDLIGKSILKLSHEFKNADVLLEFIKQSKTEPQYFEWKYSRNADDSFEAEVLLNQIVISGFHFIQVIIKDISELKKSQLAVATNEEKFKMIFNSVSDGIVIFSEEYDILEVNKTVLKHYNLTKEEFRLMPNNDKFSKTIIGSIQHYLPELENQENITFEIEELTTHDKVISLEIKVKKIEFAGKKAFMTVGRDISKRKQSQMAIFNAVIEAEEKERSRIAKELHDGVSPILSTAKLYSQSLRDCRSEDLKSNILCKIESTIDDSIQSISEISNNLSPHILENFGLTAAVQSFVDKIGNLKGLQFQIVSNWHGRLEGNLEVTLYRVIIELINNSLKHAEADTIVVNINKKKNIKLVYTDNGKGFNVKETLELKKGMGLFNIINRVKSLKGTIDYFSTSGEGLKVIVEFKL